MKILLGMSGGLDSTAAALFLKRAGHEVTGVLLEMHGYTEISSAEKSAAECGVELKILDCKDRFEKKVIEPFMEEYLACRTPNPCVFCNPAVKFGVLCEYAEMHGYDRVSTGHYCDIGCENGRYFIRRGSDTRKDQSYVLWGLSQKQLSLLYFPLAGSYKDNLRREAEKEGLSSASAKESQEICFIPDGDYAAYVEGRRGKMPEGDFISPEGKVCGTHRGLLHYTVGQRKRLGIALGRPVFISRMDSETNRIYLSEGGDEYSSGFSVSGIVRQKLTDDFSGELDCFVKHRYSAPLTQVTVNICGASARVRTDSPIRAVTPGQSAVFYDTCGDILFGGFIDS